MEWLGTSPSVCPRVRALIGESLGEAGVSWLMTGASADINRFLEELPLLARFLVLKRKKVYLSRKGFSLSFERALSITLIWRKASPISVASFLDGVLHCSSSNDTISQATKQRLKDDNRQVRVRMANPCFKIFKIALRWILVHFLMGMVASKEIGVLVEVANDLPSDKAVSAEQVEEIEEHEDDMEEENPSSTISCA